MKEKKNPFLINTIGGGGKHTQIRKGGNTKLLSPHNFKMAVCQNQEKFSIAQLLPGEKQCCKRLSKST